MPRTLIFDRNGIAVVEFALIAPVMILMLMGMVEFAYVASARSMLEAATIKGGRLIAASDCPDKRAALLQSTIENGMTEIASHDGRPPVIKSKAYGTEFGQVGEPEPYQDILPKNGKRDPLEPYTDVNNNKKWDLDMGVDDSLGDAGKIVNYTATYKVKSLVPFIAEKFSNFDYWPISASTVVRNEPVFRTKGC